MFSILRSTLSSLGFESLMAGIILDNLPFDQKEIDEAEHNTELGRFLTVWGQIEVTYGQIFKEIAGIHPNIASIIYERIGVKEQLEILEGLSDLIYDNMKENYEWAVNEVKELSKRRNKIIHSRWGYLNGEISRFWVRLTEAQLKEIMTETQKGQNYRRDRIFTITDIKKLVTCGEHAREALYDVLFALLEK